MLCRVFQRTRPMWLRSRNRLRSRVLPDGSSACLPCPALCTLSGKELFPPIYYSTFSLVAPMYSTEHALLQSRLHWLTVSRGKKHPLNAIPSRLTLSVQPNVLSLRWGLSTASPEWLEYAGPQLLLGGLFTHRHTFIETLNLLPPYVDCPGQAHPGINCMGNIDLCMCPRMHSCYFLELD